MQYRFLLGLRLLAYPRQNTHSHFMTQTNAEIISTDGIPMAPYRSFCDLPDELLLETMHHLESLRASEPQSVAMRHPKDEKIRQSTNAARQRTLHSICLTSQRLRRIATPILYASFTGTSTWRGIEHLKLFHRTISNREYPRVGELPFYKHVRYIENRLSDHRGNNLYEETEEYDTIQMIARYFYLLADIVKLSPNLQHLCVVSLEVEDISFWRHIISGSLAVDQVIESTNHSNVSFRKLETLCFQINTSGLTRISGDVWSANIFSAMTSAPQLRTIQACGVMSNNGLSAALPRSLALSRNIQRFEITKCLLEMNEVIHLWQACEGLQHITCEWAYLDSTTELPSDLLPGLLKHADTLQTLHLDLREARFELHRPPDPPLFGSLRALIHLRSLTVCERFTSDDHYIWDGRLTDLLPLSLEELAVLRHPDGLYEYGSHEDRVRNLRHLAEDCQYELPQLKYVAIHDALEFHSSELQALFNNAGVHFDIVREQP